MPTGYVGLPEFDRDAWVVGATYWPDPDIAVEVRLLDRSQPQHGDSGTQLTERWAGMVVLMRYALMSLALLVVITTGPAKAGHYSGTVINAQATQAIEISAERFSFNPSEIRVKAGTALEIRLTNQDTMHGFRILSTEIGLELPKRGRGVASVMLQSTAGRYTFECSRLCGAGHSFMRGVIIATE
jgi:cytochrome c oxidase subunit II